MREGDSDPIDPSPTIDQAINGGFPWLVIECFHCKAKRDVDLARCSCRKLRSGSIDGVVRQEQGWQQCGR